jgi:hypothetical protein
METKEIGNGGWATFTWMMRALPIIRELATWPQVAIAERG